MNGLDLVNFFDSYATFFLQIGDETFMGNQLATPDELRPADLRKIYPMKDMSGWRRSWRQVIQLASTLY